MQNKTKTTPLYDWHKQNHANMFNFSNYEMPLWYPSGAKLEHLAVLTNAGLFDTSHMAVLMITGTDAFSLLQTCYTRDLRGCIGKNKTPLEPGKCIYGAFLTEQGQVIDDALVYQLSADTYMTVINSGMGDKMCRHLREHIGTGDALINDFTDKIGKIDIQGPMTAKILLKILADPQNILSDMGYFTFKGHFDETSECGRTVQIVDGPRILLSRTGYTGEFGFEIFVSANDLVNIWEKLLAAGRDLGLIPCGLAARDSLRAGAVLPLSNKDIGLWPFINNPWTCALPYDDKGTGFTKTFVGSSALSNIKEPEYTYPFVGFDLRKVSSCKNPAVLDSKKNEIGMVLTCVSDMSIGRDGDRIFSISSPDRPKDFRPKGLCCGFVKVKKQLDFGQIVELKDTRRKIKVMITEQIRPDRTSWSPISERM